MSVFNFKWLASLILYLNWRFGKKKEEPTCEHCGGVLKYHAWSDCSGDRAMAHTASNPPSAKAKAFYNSIGHKAGEETPKMCPCNCGKPLSTDHLRGIKFVHLENGDPALVNIECSEKFAAGIPFPDYSDTDPRAGGDSFSCVYRGPGGPRMFRLN